MDQLGIWSTVSGLVLLRSLINGLATFLAVRFFSVGTKPASDANGPSVVIILPVLRESGRLRETLDYIETHAPPSRILECVIVGTASERGADGINPTIALARSLSDGRPLFQVLEAPDPAAIKADQINWAALDIARRYDPGGVWLFLMDIDTQFSVATLEEASALMGLGADVIQEHSIFLADFERLPFIQQAHALYQSRWTLAHELKNNWLSNVSGWYVSHIVGHGAFIRLRSFNALGGMPRASVTEDLHFGYYIVASGYRIHSLRTLSVSETPDTLSAALAQQKTWAFGPLLYAHYRARMRADIPAAFAKNRFRSFVIATVGIATFLNWLLLFPGILMILALAVHGQSLAWAALGIYVADLTLASWFFAQRGWISRDRLWLAPLLMIVHLPIRTLAAWRALIDFMLGRGVTRIKTNNRVAEERG